MAVAHICGNDLDLATSSHPSILAPFGLPKLITTIRNLWEDLYLPKLNYIQGATCPDVLSSLVPAKGI